MKCLILDFSALTSIDPSGVQLLKILIQDFNKLFISILIAGCSCPVHEVMKKCELQSLQGKHFQLFPSVHDAVYYIETGSITVLPS